MIPVPRQLDIFGVRALMKQLSALKILKFGLAFSPTELITLLVGMVVAFVVSVLSIKWLMAYVRRHDFKVFGWYRIVLGIVVIVYTLLK